MFELISHSIFISSFHSISIAFSSKNGRLSGFVSLPRTFGVWNNIINITILFNIQLYYSFHIDTRLGSLGPYNRSSIFTGFFCRPTHGISAHGFGCSGTRARFFTSSVFHIVLQIGSIGPNVIAITSYFH